MRAILVDSDAPGRFVLGEVDERDPLPDEAVVQVEAISLNQGEVRMARDMAPPGYNPGWDFAGVVSHAAVQGGGPAAGDRVVGVVETGAWRERVVVPARSLAVLPDKVSTAVASALPVAGLTALLSLQEGGLLLGRRVLINGASGGVGHLAVQLAHAAGAFVVAAVRREPQRVMALADGADVAVVTESLEETRDFGPFDFILESVGGAAFANAGTLLANGGTCVTCGNSSRETSEINPISLFYPARRTRLLGFHLFPTLALEPASFGLGRLIGLVAQGRLTPRIETQASWEDFAAIAEQFISRALTGKVVLHLEGATG